MNIQLVYNSNSYKFDIPPNKTVNYLKGLACKIFNLKKEFSELVYRKKNISKEFLSNGNRTSQPLRLRQRKHS